MSGAFQTFFKFNHNEITDFISRVVHPFIQCLKIESKYSDRLKAGDVY